MLLFLAFTLKECSPYWGQEKTKFEDIEVEVTETECTPVFTVRTMQIYHTKVPGALGGVNGEHPAQGSSTQGPKVSLTPWIEKE